MSEDPPKPGSLVFAVGEVATGAGGAGSSMGDHTGESGAGHDINTGKELRLASVAGAPDMVYSWPLTVGKGGTFYYLNTMLCYKHHVIMQGVLRKEKMNMIRLWRY